MSGKRERPSKASYPACGLNRYYFRSESASTYLCALGMEIPESHEEFMVSHEF